MLLNEIDSYEVETFSSFYNLLRERFIRQRWSLWPAFVLLGSLNAFTSCRRSPKHWYFQVSLTLPVTALIAQQTSGVVGSLTALRCSLSRAFAGLVGDSCRTGLRAAPTQPGAGGSRAPRGAASRAGSGQSREESSGYHCRLWPERLCQLQGQLSGTLVRMDWGWQSPGAGGASMPSQEGWAGPRRELCATQGAGGPRAWGQGGCLFLVRVL